MKWNNKTITQIAKPLAYTFINAQKHNNCNSFFWSIRSNHMSKIAQQMKTVFCNSLFSKINEIEKNRNKNERNKQNLGRKCVLFK